MTKPLDVLRILAEHAKETDVDWRAEFVRLYDCNEAASLMRKLDSALQAMAESNRQLARAVDGVGTTLLSLAKEIRDSLDKIAAASGGSP